MPKSENIRWHRTTVSREDRERLRGHRGAALWFTGLSGSGKSTLANAVEEALFERGYQTFVLDGDNIRHGLNRDLGFSPEDRTENIRRIGEIAKLFVQSGTLVLTAFISPYRKDRDTNRAIMDEGDFIEIHVEAPLDVCEARDPKGLYRKARAGEIKEFTGISAPYEVPEHPEIVVHTGNATVEACVEQIVGWLEAQGYLAHLDQEAVQAV